MASLLACRSQARAPDAAVAKAVPDAAVLRDLIAVQQITVEAAAWPEIAGPPPEERLLANRIWENLSQSDSFEATGRRSGLVVVPDAGGVRRRPARVRAVYGLEPAPPSMRALATLTVEFSDDNEGPELFGNVACEGDLPKDRKDLAGVAANLVECAVGRAAQDLVEKEKLRRGDLPAVLKALDDPEPGVRQTALAAIGERRLVGAIPRLIELLQSKDELVRDGAIGALVALGDRRAVKPLTELAEFKDLDLMRRIIDAVGSLGGDDARAYLELVASGHQVPIIRELAQGALQRMDRRGDAGARANFSPSR